MRLITALLLLASSLPAQDDLAALRSQLTAATTKHLDMLLDKDGKVMPLKGKSSDAMTASAFQIAYEFTDNPKYKAAALQLADRIVKAMRATKFGVLYIKEKDKADGSVIPGGGPPAMGWYTATAADILHRHPGREADVKYIATVADNFPWNEEGWWSADIDVKTGISKQPISKPSPINKNVAMAAAAARIYDAVRDIDPALAARLRHKAETCIYKQVLPAQEKDGYWHYGLTGNDPKNKDILGYFMVTMDGLIQLRAYTNLLDKPAAATAFEKAGAFAARCIASIADPDNGKPCANRTTPATPSHYTIKDDPRRGFQLALTLVATRQYQQAIALLNVTVPHFAYGSGGTDGSHAVHPSTLMLRLLRQN
ncbi:MAG: hypothetical protein HY820_27455 [Acidobacteria bacterium]|nr:hypothetical protein [Acidobacteriota bacterium]